MKRDLLYASPCCGSMIVEMASALASYPIDIIDLEWSVDGISDPRLAALNPLSQVPVLARVSGEVLTQSAAIILLLADTYPAAELSPCIRHKDRAAFFQWLMFVNTAIYPTFTYGDFPRKWAGETGAVALKASTTRHRTDNYLILEAACVGPYFLGQTMSAIDLYVFAFSTWSPREFWQSGATPKLLAITSKLRENDLLKAAIARNVPSD